MHKVLSDVGGKIKSRNGMTDADADGIMLLEVEVIL